MPRSRADWDAIRASNRATLGLGALGIELPSFDPSALSSVAGGVRVTTQFPATDFTWQPGATTPAPAPDGSAGGSPWGEWIMAHLTRLKIEWGGLVLDPYRDRADYSGIARVLGIGAAAVGAGAVAWLLVRALWPTRRANPRRSRACSPSVFFGVPSWCAPTRRRAA